MISLEAKFSETYDKLSDPQRKKFDAWLKEARGKYGERRNKVTIEMQLAAAERIAGSKVTTESLRESHVFTGKRNNGAVLPLTEAELKTAAMQESQYKAYRKAGLNEAEAKEMSGFDGGNLPEKIVEAGPRAIADFRFLREGLRMSIADATRGALDTTLLRKPEEQIKD